MDNRRVVPHWYLRVDVWKQEEGERLVCYRCFQVFPESKYCVQSKDFYPISPETKLMLFFEKQFAELLAETAPEDRDLCATLEEAISEFDLSFM